MEGWTGATLRTQVEMGALIALAILRGALTAMVEPQVFPDSKRYLFPEDPFRVFRVDIAQGPGVLNQLLYMIPLEQAVVIQSVVAGLLWGSAAWVATRGLSRGWYWAALVFTLSPWWVAFDSAALTESLSLASMALFAAGAASWMRGRSAVPMVIGAAVTLLSRPLSAALVFGILLVVVVARRALPGRVATAILVLALVFGGAQSVAFSRAVADFTYLPQPSSIVSVQATDRMGTRGASEGYRDLTERFGMPECPEAFAVAEEPAGAHKLRRLDCPGMREWFAGGGVPWWAEIVYYPGETASTMWEKLAPSTTYAGYAPEEWGPLREPTVAHRVSLLMWGTLLIAALSMLRPGRLWWARALLIGGVTTYGVLLTLVDGLEPWRHMAPALAVIVPMALAAWPRPADERRPRGGSSAADEMHPRDGSSAADDVRPRAGSSAAVVARTGPHS